MSYPIQTQLFAALLLLGTAACLVLLARHSVRKVRGRQALGSVAHAGASGVRSRPRRLGPYTLANKIGQGAMGEVYRAWHVTLQRWCAIKLLSPHASEREKLRFEREAALTARLDHPNAVAIYDSGRAPDGTSYLVLELLDGINLQQLVERHGAQPPARVIQILLGVCAALSEAHGAGLIHRDIKPDNVVLCERNGGPERAKLLDFGLAKHVDDGADPSESTNSLVGTPLYLSPEAITEPASVSVQADLYGLGAVAYFLLTGTPVFNGKSLVEVCAQHLHSTPSPSRACPSSSSPTIWSGSSAIVSPKTRGIAPPAPPSSRAGSHAVPMPTTGARRTPGVGGKIPRTTARRAPRRSSCSSKTWRARFRRVRSAARKTRREPARHDMHAAREN